MARVFTADEILTLARQLGSIHESAADGTEDADLLRFINFYLQSEMAPAIMNVREAYYSRSVRTALAASTSAYRINHRAMLNREIDVRYVSSDGYYTPALERVSEGHLDQVYDGGGASKPSAFFVRGNYIHLLPSLGASPSGSIEQTFAVRPSELVLAANVRTITDVNTTTKVITTSSAIPAGWGTGDTFDVHSYQSGAELKCWDKAVSAASGTSMTFSTAIDGSLSGEYQVEVGDYVCLAKEAGVPAVPYEFHQILAQAVAAKFTEVIDPEASKLHTNRLVQMMKLALSAMEPRVEHKKTRIRKIPLIAAQGRGRISYG